VASKTKGLQKLNLKMNVETERMEKLKRGAKNVKKRTTDKNQLKCREKKSKAESQVQKRHY